MQSEPLVSVIVPIFNVEAWLPRCLDSILTQTYRNLEIILVDDGSPDRSGEICDQYGEKDSRIRVIHQQNRGASAARNRGLDAATGVWISFIDSDDWIETDFYETLLHAARSYNADVVCCGFSCVDRPILRDALITVLEGKEILYQLLERKYGAPSLCNKLFRSTLKSSLKNREDIQLNEDFAANYEVCKKAKRMVFVSKALYHYTTRKTGCVKGYTPGDNRTAVKLAVERAEQERRDTRAYNLCLRHCITMRLREINQMIKYGQICGKLMQMRTDLLADYRNMNDHGALSRRERYMVWLMQYLPALYPAIVKAKFRIKKV